MVECGLRHVVQPGGQPSTLTPENELAKLKETNKALLILRKDELLADFKIFNHGTSINVHKAILAGKEDGVFNYLKNDMTRFFWNKEIIFRIFKF